MPPGPAPRPLPPTWTDPIDGWSAHLRAAGQTPATLRQRRSIIRQFATAHTRRSPWTLTTSDLETWLAAHEHWSPAARKNAVATLRGFYSWAHRAGRCTRNPAARLPRVRVPTGLPRPAPEHAITTALTTADPRVILAIRVAAELGLRRAEVAAVHARHLTLTRDGWTLLVTGKGGHQRRIPVPDDLAHTIRTTAAGGWLIRTNTGTRMSPDRLGRLVTAALPPGWTMHTLRHRFATAVHDATGDLLALQRLLGHASVATTQVYAGIGDERLRVSVDAARLRPGLHLAHPPAA